MDFQRKSVPFLHQGMNWNSPVEKLKDGQVCWAKNVRVLEQGSVSSAHGYSQLWQIRSSAYVHSGSRLNIFNQQFDPNLTPVWVIGGDDNLYVAQDQGIIDALNPVATPLTPEYGFHAFSGNPLSIVDAQPAGAAVAWKYIGDSKQMVTVGYYPSDHYGDQARCLTIGLDPPLASWYDPAHGVTGGTATDIGSTGSTGSIVTVDSFPTSNLQGNYQWMFAFRRVQTGARSNPSAATRFTSSVPAMKVPYYDSGSGTGQVVLRLPQAPNDPKTGQPDANVVVDIYRFGGNIARWALVGSQAGSLPGQPSLFYDNTPDASLLTAPGPPQLTDSQTGLTRFNLFRPFVTQDIARSGRGSLQELTGPTIIDNTKSPRVFILQTADGNLFNPQWLAGSTIYLKSAVNGSGIACTIYQVISPTEIEIAEDLTGHMTSSSGPLDFGLGQIVWSTNAGTLMAGQPLPHLWGPYGIGQSGMYLFACGDPNAPGTLYWTNGNDPDSTDVVNNIIVTSPSERLTTGCVYNGQPWCWSTERQFQIFPSLTIFGQFTSQEIAGAKGCWLEWSLSVQSNGFADQSVSWRGKDGIYDFSAGSGLQRLTDPLYAFFPHDNAPSEAPETILPFIGANSQEPESVGLLDDTQPKYHRLTWFHGLLFYDFVALTGNEVSTFSTLVWDTVNIPGGGGWVSLDQPFPDQSRPVARWVDVGANQSAKDVISTDEISGQQTWGPAQRGGSLKVAWGNQVNEYYGYTRGGFSTQFESRFITRAEDMGDSRAQKRWGDFWLDCTPLTAFTVFPLAGFHRCILGPVDVPSTSVATSPDFCPATEPGVRAQFICDFQEFVGHAGAALMSPTLGLDIRWRDPNSQFASSLYQWQPSFTPKPEAISFRATDPDDLGALQAKYFTGFNLEANTFGSPLVLLALIDGKNVGAPTITHDGQSEAPYAFTPVAGYEAQLQMNTQTDALGYPITWQFFKVKWIFEPWPDAVARKFMFSNLGTPGAKYIRGIVLPMETGGVPGTVGLWADDSEGTMTWTKVTGPLLKTGIDLDITAPFTAHIVQWETLSPCRIWPDEALVVFDPWPESSNASSPFTDLGYKGPKFIQGLNIPMETGGKPISLTIQTDCSTTPITVGPFQTQTDCKNNFAISLSPCNTPPSQPLIATQIQVSPLGGDARIWYDEAQWYWEPAPELAATWTTQPTTHDLPGWTSQRDCWIAYQGGNGTPSLYITTQFGTETYPLDPVTPGLYTRVYRVLKPQKASWRSYNVEGCGMFRLYKRDCEIRIKAWGSTGPYQSFMPFGGPSRVDGAKI